MDKFEQLIGDEILFDNNLDELFSAGVEVAKADVFRCKIGPIYILAFEGFAVVYNTELDYWAMYRIITGKYEFETSGFGAKQLAVEIPDVKTYTLDRAMDDWYHAFQADA
jgi:hypothetical protein